jgi:hypothetical protein
MGNIIIKGKKIVSLFEVISGVLDIAGMKF